MCNSVPSAGPPIQLPLGRTFTQTTTPAVPSNNSTSKSPNGNTATGAQAPASAYPHLGQQLNLSI